MSSLIDVVFPHRCVGCDRPGSLLCERCAAAVAYIDPSVACPRCGAPDGRLRCDECAGTTFAFSAALAAALLEPPVSSAVVLLKDGGERRLAALLAEWLAQAAGDWLDGRAVLVPVPASPDAVRRRGFDHTAHIARALGALSGARVLPLLCAAASTDQRALGKDARFANRMQAYRLRPGVERPSSVVLVDDVLTTGATLHAAARALREGGHTEVRALVVARACRPRRAAASDDPGA